MPRACQRNRRSRKAQRKCGVMRPGREFARRSSTGCRPAGGAACRELVPSGSWAFAFCISAGESLRAAQGNRQLGACGYGNVFSGQRFFRARGWTRWVSGAGAGQSSRTQKRSAQTDARRTRTSADILATAVPNEKGRMGPIRACLDRVTCCGQECPRSAPVQGHKSQTLCARGVSPRTASNKTAILTSRRTRHQSAR